MAKATWQGATLVESSATQQVEGNVYFPLEAVDANLLRESSHTSFCPWKGTASYFDIVVGGKVNENAAWTYRDPKPEAAHIKNHVAFWRGVEVQ